MSSIPTTSKIIKFSGYYNFLIAHLIPIPLLQGLFGLDLPLVASGLISMLLLYTAAMLIIGSQDLHRYQRVILFEALLRFGGAFLLITTYIFSNQYSGFMFLAGVTDGLLGIAYCFIVTSATNQSFSEIIFGNNNKKLSLS